MPKDVNKINPNNPVKTGGAVVGGGFSTSYFNADRHLKRDELNDSKDVNRYDETADSIPFATGSLTNVVQDVIKSRAHLGFVDVHNPGAATAFVQFFDMAASSVVLGTTKPAQVYPVPSNTARTIPLPDDSKVEFIEGISVVAAGTYNGTGLLAQGVNISLGYSHG